MHTEKYISLRVKCLLYYFDFKEKWKALTRFNMSQI